MDQARELDCYELNTELARLLFCEPSQLSSPANIIIQCNEFTKANKDSILLLRTKTTAILSLAARPYSLVAPILPKLKSNSRLSLLDLATLLQDRKQIGSHYGFSLPVQTELPVKDLEPFEDSVLISQRMNQNGIFNYQDLPFQFLKDWKIGFSLNHKYQLQAYQPYARIQFETVDLKL